MAVGKNSEDFDLRRRRLRFRAWHRGTREMDLILGRFADAALVGMNDSELDEFEGLMELPDPDLFSWVLGQSPVPPAQDTPLFRRLSAFHRTGEGAAGG